MRDTGQGGLHCQANGLLRIAYNAQDRQVQLFGQGSQWLQQRLLKSGSATVFQALGEIGQAQPRVAQHIQAEVALLRLHAIYADDQSLMRGQFRAQSH